MNKRIAKKLKKEMDSWNKDSLVRHSLSTFKKAWKLEIEMAIEKSKKEEQSNVRHV
jgi:hypothetical protein